MKLEHNPRAMDVIEVLGGAVRTAEYFGISRDAVYKWTKDKDGIPDPEALLPQDRFHYMWYHSQDRFVKKPSGVRK